MNGSRRMKKSDKIKNFFSKGQTKFSDAAEKSVFHKGMVIKNVFYNILNVAIYYFWYTNSNNPLIWCRKVNKYILKAFLLTSSNLISSNI